MNFTKLLPNIFYTDIKSGIKLFVDCLEFKIGHQELTANTLFCVVEKNSLRVNLFQNQESAEKDNPEFRLVTENIEEVYEKVQSKHNIIFLKTDSWEKDVFEFLRMTLQ